MIPIRDHNPSGEIPIITYLFIAINVLVFLYMSLLPTESIENLIQSYGLIPLYIIKGQQLETFITSMFIHGSLGHLAGNMLFLKIFGDNLENRLGRVKYLLFYIICGVFASLAQILSDPFSAIPQIGASGAIAGLMGGYLMLFPTNRIDVIFRLGPVLESGSVPAFAMLGYWFVAQMFSGVGSLASTEDICGVAYLAHIGGFIMGFIFTRTFKPKQDNYYQ